jgi:pgm_bpd_ind: 2,3-bisphosphoglycerate-independent phosphoglycerate mutase
MSKKPTVLMILDGYGLNENKEANAVAEAKTPVMDKLMKEYPFVKGTHPEWQSDFQKVRWVILK